ncbi:DUF6624 domain-containing protein [Terrimonas rubra]|uniref:DUF6624 domain-containing protein n=1 Tax=Terrimonas rubra TaxID=1035890 RepID=A0ABW6A5W5_9BACT
MRYNMAFLSLLVLLLNQSLCAQVTAYSYDPNAIDKALAAQLDSLYKEDQQYRIALGKLKKEGAPQKSVDSLTALLKQADSSNLVFVEQLIAQHGWITPGQAGFMGTQAVFLVIQHADLEAQKKYYPLIKQAEKDGNILSSNVAILEDRIAVREGKPQPYGSQGYYDAEKKKTYVYPLKDLNNLDSLRKSMGLQPMKEYIKDWNPEDYTSYLPYATELLKKQVQ